MFDGLRATFKKREEFRPMLFVDFDWINVKPSKEKDYNHGKETFAVILGDEASVEARKHILHGMGAAVATAELMELVSAPKMIRVAAEGWMHGDNKSKKKYKMPSEDPNKREVIMVMTLDPQGMMYMRAQEITRSIATKGNLMGMIAGLKDDFCEDSYFKSEGVGLLETFYDGYRAQRTAMVVDGDFAQYIEEAKKRPEEIFELIMRTAIENAKMAALRRT